MWVVTNKLLKLTLYIDYIKYSQQSYVMPPQELGKCKDWIFTMSKDEQTAVFQASWELQRVKSMNIDFGEIESNFENFIIH